MVDKTIEILTKLFETLTIEKVTLISVLVTLLIFILSNQSNIKFKQFDKRRKEYTKFIQMLQQIYNNNISVDDKTKKLFFDTGVSLLLYGSKKYIKNIYFLEII